MSGRYLRMSMRLAASNRRAAPRGDADWASYRIHQLSSRLSAADSGETARTMTPLPHPAIMSARIATPEIFGRTPHGNPLVR